MPGLELTAALFGLASAAFWGAGDFAGGVAAKRTGVYLVVLLSHIVGLAGLLLLIGFFDEPLPGLNVLLVGVFAGIAGAVGVAALYTGLAQGQMGVVAPLTAVVTAVVPVLFSLFLEGLPRVSQLLGFALALTAVWLISGGGGGLARLRWGDLRLPVIAGLGFGLFFVAIDRVSDQAILWPLVGARSASILMMFFLALITRQIKRPAVGQLGLILLVGFSDTAGNAFFALATSLGRLDIAAVLGSLYPAATILLARFFLDEQLNRRQWIGLAAALLAVILITL